MVPHMAQFQNMLDFPPAPKLTVLGKLDPTLATEQELAGKKYSTVTANVRSVIQVLTF